MKEAPFFLRVASPEEIEEDRIRREEEERRARKLKLLPHDRAPLPYDSHSILFHELKRKVDRVFSGTSTMERLHAGCIFFYGSTTKKYFYGSTTKKYAFLLNYSA